MSWKRTTEKGYIWDNRIFLIAFLLMFAYVGKVIYDNGYKSTPYVNCEKPTCPNPIKDINTKCEGLACAIAVCEEEWCNWDILPKGEYGKRPINTNLFLMACIVLLGIAFNINHFIHNKGKNVDFDFANTPLGKAIKKVEKVKDDENNMPKV